MTRPTHIPARTPPEELAAYPASRAAQILRLSPSTLRLWAVGDRGHRSLFAPADKQPLTLSFSNLVEAFVLASIRRVHGVSMQRVRKALHLVGTEMGIRRPLIHARFKTDGKRLFIEQAGRFLEASQPEQALLEKIRGFGQPAIAGTGVQARIVAERYRAGESIRDLADDYSLALDLIEDAIRCETVTA